MNVLIFSGGTGSIALQTGFSTFYDHLLNVKILTNCYDNGKSTGQVRQVYDGKILGPSDLRKNQTTQYKLSKNSDKNYIESNDPLLKFLEKRFDAKASEAEEFCLEELFDLQKHISSQSYSILLLAINHFFEQPKSKQIYYSDFSLSNIVYAGLAGQNNYSLIAAGKIMAKILDIPENSVILNDDKSLFLRAETENGKHILDEGEIVDWNNTEDKIKRVYFVDSHGQVESPTLSQESIDAINEADIIIFSSGTQWSSLIPTYLSSGPKFRTIIEKSKAKKYLVINNQPDKDMFGVGIENILEILYDFLPLDSITKIFNTNAHPLMQMSRVSDKTNCFEFTTSFENTKTHRPIIVKRIMELYYSDYIKNEKIVFDYDDTLVGRNNEFLLESEFNMQAINLIKTLNKDTCIFTGNSIRSINFIGYNRTSPLYYLLELRNNIKNKLKTNVDQISTYNETYKIYADGGINIYNVYRNEISYVECVDKAGLFTNNEINDLIKTITEIGLNVSKIQNRNNATVSIKPIDDEYRVPICKLLQILTKNAYNIRPTGRTTIDISQHINNKELSFNHLKQTLKRGERITYVGDESHEGGNDNILLKNDMIDYLHVNNPRDTMIFFITILNSDNEADTKIINEESSFSLFQNNG